MDDIEKRWLKILGCKYWKPKYGNISKEGGRRLELIFSNNLRFTVKGGRTLTIHNIVWDEGFRKRLRGRSIRNKSADMAVMREDDWIYFISDKLG